MTTLHVLQRLRAFGRKTHDACPLCQNRTSARVVRCLYRSTETEIVLDCAACGAHTTIIRKEKRAAG